MFVKCNYHIHLFFNNASYGLVLREPFGSHVSSLLM
jgi:hypothetical protein